MKEVLSLRVGDVLTLKKPHPCGSYDWQVSRVGADVGLICLGCGRRIMVPRYRLRKMVKKVNGVEYKYSG